jgi:hypothetical protein
LVLVFFIVTAAMARDIGSAAWLHLVSDWLDYRRCRISYGELAGMMPRQAVNLFTFSVRTED